MGRGRREDRAGPAGLERRPSTAAAAAARGEGAPAGRTGHARDGRALSEAGTADVLRNLARPRFAGSAGWREAHEYVAGTFEALGYAVERRPFPACTLPGRFALPAAGFALFGSSAAAILTLLEGQRTAALIALAAGALLVGIVARGTAAATDRWRRGRIELCNLFVRWPGSQPRCLFVAHLDSKSQFVPLSLRASAAGGAVLAWGALLLLALLGGTVSRDPLILGVLAVLATLAGVPLLLSGSANDSPGALDNASGVATLIGLAHAERGASDIAFLITDGEELGLAGSRAAVRQGMPAFGAVINIDGVDDEGGFYVLDRYGFRREQPPTPAARALLASAPASNTWVHRRRVPFGLVLDHMSFARAGISALTLMRGTFRSLARVHRPADDLNHLRGAGVDDAVRLLRAALQELRR